MNTDVRFAHGFSFGLRPRAVRVLGVVCACVLLAAAPPHTTIYGFSVTSSEQEFALEDRFLDIPSSAGALESAAALAAQPHYAGSPGDYKLALYVRERFKEDGFDTSLETLTARVDTPKKLALELIPTGFRPYRPAAAPLLSRGRSRRNTPAGPIGIPPQAAVVLDLRDLPDPNDADTANPAIGLPFIAGSADGDVTAPLIYVNYGMPSDYAALQRMGLSVKGKIVIARYGVGWRGLKPKLAYEHGAVGCII